MATGHQRSDGRKHQVAYLQSRSEKLREQLPERHPDATDVLRGVRVYIDGYISVATDIQMKKLVTLAGGEVSSVSAPFCFPSHVSAFHTDTQRLAQHMC